MLAYYGDKLNEKELQLICLMRAGFDTAEISALIQQSNTTIYQRRTSIRNKLKISDKGNILIYILEDMEERENNMPTELP